MDKAVKLTTRGRYAVMAMVELAEQNSEEPVPLSEVAKRGNISLSYLEQLIAGLRRYGLVKSYRGPGGGYVLARNPNDITVAEILIAAEDSTPAKRGKQTKKTEDCEHTEALWHFIETVLYRTLKDVSLYDVIADKVVRHPAVC